MKTLISILFIMLISSNTGAYNAQKPHAREKYIDYSCSASVTVDKSISYKKVGNNFKLSIDK